MPISNNNCKKVIKKKNLMRNLKSNFPTLGKNLGKQYTYIILVYIYTYYIFILYK